MPKIILKYEDDLDRPIALAFFSAILKKYQESTITPPAEYPVLFVWDGMLLVFKVTRRGTLTFRIKKDACNA